MNTKTKKFKIIVVSVAAVLLLAAVAALVLALPRNAKLDPLIWSVSDRYDASAVQSIEKGAGEDFKILQLTDTQLWFGGKDNKEALRIVEDTVKAATDAGDKPDLVVLTGDNVSGWFTDSYLKKLIKTMEGLDVPWTAVYGNHDGEGRSTLSWQSKRYEAAKNSMFENGPTNLSGYGNHAINLVQNDEIVYSLIMLDSHAGIDKSYGIGGYDFIKHDQIAWYEWNINGLTQEAGKLVPSMLFFHIPLPEYKDAMMALPEDENGVRWVPQEKGFGYIKEGVAAPKYNSGLYDVMQRLGSTKYFFVGHDHNNTASFDLDGITMTYGQKTGPSPAPWNDQTEFGGTLITIGAGGANVGIRHIVVA